MKAIAIFNEIQILNPKTSVISSLGSFISNENQMISDNLRGELMKFVDNNSLAFSILRDSENLSEKQLWVISFELLKNKNYCDLLQSSIDERNEQIAYQKSRKSAKRAAKKEEVKTIKTEKAENEKKAASMIESQVVKHDQFGIGQVLFQDEKVITILFETVGEKKLLKAFAKLETI